MHKKYRSEVWTPHDWDRYNCQRTRKRRYRQEPPPYIINIGIRLIRHFSEAVGETICILYIYIYIYIYKYIYLAFRGSYLC